MLCDNIKQEHSKNGLAMGRMDDSQYLRNIARNTSKKVMWFDVSDKTILHNYDVRWDSMPYTQIGHFAVS